MQSRLRRDVELVVFDLDGTLVDSREDIAGAVNQGLQAVGGPGRPGEDIYPLIGRPLLQIFAELLPPGLGARAVEAQAVFRRYYLDHCFDRSRLYPGVVECIERMKSVPLAVATTKMTFMAIRVIEHTGLAPHFSLVQGSDDIPHKPDPTLLRIVLGKTGKQAERSWMVGDTVYDIQAGKAAGMRTCAVTYGIGSVADLGEECPDLMVASLAELPSRLGFP
jgi:HAD superfamily hydrolase (TIGR01549 family)